MNSNNINNSARLIGNINSPSDLRLLPQDDLPVLCDELRDDLVASVSESGGHLASSLGVVELTVALHYAFNTPEDRIIWDVGHQAYIHKMLTGRRQQMATIRKFNGISGFPKRSESEYDAFGVGHAGTSLSAALGMLEASYHDYPGNKDRAVISVIGDGAMTSGMVFEALNHSGQLQRKLIIVLNDNGMSIAPNVGAISWAFSRTVTGKYSTAVRKHFKSLVEKRLFPRTFYKVLDRIEESTQGFLSTPALLYHAFGHRYIGPIDGHDISQLLDAFQRAKDQEGPVVIHAITTKGKGYEPAESDPRKFHGVSPFEIKNGHFKNVLPIGAPSYTEVFGTTLVHLCKTDPRIVGITAAMPDGTGLEQLRQKMPDRFFDVGICEEHAVTFAAGLAAEGMKPFCAIYSSFMQRAYDQILHDLCLQSLPVVLILDRAGIVGPDGPTHHGVFDYSFLRHLPNITIMAPKDEAELRDMIITAAYHDLGPIAIRFPRGNGVGIEISKAPNIIPIGEGEIVSQTKSAAGNVLIIGIGNTVQTAIKAAKTLREESKIGVTVFNARFIKPLDRENMRDLILSHPLTVTIEDNVLQGGFGSTVLEFISDEGLTQNTQLLRLGIEDNFIPHGTIKELHQLCNIDPKSVVSRIKAELRQQKLMRKLAVI